MAQREPVARIEASLPMDGQECVNVGHYRGRDRRLGVDHSMPAGDVRSLG
jgi:hypothetical protein